MISEEKISMYKARLVALRDELEAQIKEYEKKPEFGDYPGDEDEMDEAQELANNQSKAQAFRDRLANVEHALVKIEKGTYGVCEESGKDIPEEVLDVNPEAKLHPDVMKKS
jgi:RNA polymerase-binding transcription factor DksA